MVAWYCCRIGNAEGSETYRRNSVAPVEDQWVIGLESHKYITIHCSSSSPLQRIFIQRASTVNYVTSPSGDRVLLLQAHVLSIRLVLDHHIIFHRVPSVPMAESVIAFALYGEAQRRPWPSCKGVSVDTRRV
jgi:hypothetical protein